MSYFGILFWFIILPIIGVLIVTRGQFSKLERRLLAIIVVVALVYTTPWDNYLVASSVWWYDPVLVSGITIGYVPIEEYSFFVLQSLFVGILTLLVLRPIVSKPISANPRIAKSLTLTGLPLTWIAMIAILWTHWMPGRYLALILAWAIPPITLQLAVGFDALWSQRRVVGGTILITTLYLSVVDAFAIHWGTWSISPTQTFGLNTFGLVPVEEITFFLVTNVLIVFTMTLGTSTAIHDRIKKWKPNLSIE